MFQLQNEYRQKTKNLQTSGSNKMSIEMTRQKHNELNSKYENLSNFLTENTNEHRFLQEKIQKLEFEIAEENQQLIKNGIKIEADNATLESQYKNLNLKVKEEFNFYKTKRDERNARNNELEQLKSDNARLTHQKDNLIVTAKKLEKEHNVDGFITKLAEDLSKNQEDNSGPEAAGAGVADFNATSNDALKNTKEQLDYALSNHLDQNKIDQIILKGKQILAERTENLKSLQTSLKTLRSTINAKRSDKDLLQSSYEDLDQQYKITNSALESSVNSLKREVTEAAIKYYQLETDMTSLEAELNLNNNLSSDSENMKEFVDKMKSENNELKNVKRELENEISKLRSQPKNEKMMEAWSVFHDYFSALNAESKGASGTS